MSKNSLLYKSSNIKLLIPEAKESGHGIAPTSSTTAQLAIGGHCNSFDESKNLAN